MPLTAAQKAAKAQKAAQQKAYEQQQANAIMAYGASYGKTGPAKGIGGQVPLSGSSTAPVPVGLGGSASSQAAPQPYDPSFEAQKLGAQYNISTGAAEATYQTGQTAYESGYNQDGSVNSANPYSQAQQYMDAWKRSVTGTNNSMAASGQLYSGARVNAQGRNDRGYAMASDALKRSTADRYHQIGVGQLQNYGQNATGVTGAQYDALRRSVYGS